MSCTSRSVWVIGICCERTPARRVKRLTTRKRYMLAILIGMMTGAIIYRSGLAGIREPSNLLMEGETVGAIKDSTRSIPESNAQQIDDVSLVGSTSAYIAPSIVMAYRE